MYTTSLSSLLRLRIFALVCFALLPFFSNPAMSSPPVTQRTAVEWIKLFQIPDAADSWEIEVRIAGVLDVRLQLPDASRALQDYPHDVRAYVEQRTHLREKNLEILRKSLSNVATVLDKEPFSMHPEYEQSLTQILMSLYPDYNGQQAIFRHLPLLKALPEYTEFDMFVPEHLSQQTERELNSNQIANKHTIHAVPVSALITTGAGMEFPTNRWARDMLEVAVGIKDHAIYGLIPLAHAKSDDLTKPDNQYLQSLADSAFQVLTVPLFFRSGNLFVGVARGKRYLFIGENELTYAKTYYQNAFFYSPPKTALLELFKALSGVDSVVELPNSKHFFHLDMMLLALAPDVAGILDPMDPAKVLPEDAKSLNTVRQKLQQLGFKLISIPTTAANISAFQSSTNAIPFRHKKTGRLTVLVPQFAKVTLNDSGKDIVLQDQVEHAYRGAGYDVIFVEDRFSDVHGNVHCAVHSLE